MPFPAAAIGPLAGLTSGLVGQRQVAPAAPAVGLLGGQGVGGQDQDDILKAILEMAGQNNFGSDPVGEAIGQQPPIADEPAATTIANRFKGFGANLNDTLNSPSQTLGIGLLGRVDPRLGLAGLLAGGLFGGN